MASGLTLFAVYLQTYLAGKGCPAIVVYPRGAEATAPDIDRVTIEPAGCRFEPQAFGSAAFSPTGKVGVEASAEIWVDGRDTRPGANAISHYERARDTARLVLCALSDWCMSEHYGWRPASAELAWDMPSVTGSGCRALLTISLVEAWRDEDWDQSAADAYATGTFALLDAGGTPTVETQTIEVHP